jgi:hypothetical protein
MRMYLDEEKVVSRCQKSQSQNLSVKNPKDQAGIEATLSHAQIDRDTTEEVEVESRADEERSSTHTEAAKGVDIERCADGDEVDTEQRIDVGGVGERRPQPREEAARVDVERRADKDEVSEKRP